MKNDLISSKDKVTYERWTNKAKNAQTEIGRVFLNFALILKEIKDKGIYSTKYNNFKDYMVNEINLDWRTGYDYIKIADFVQQNIEIITKEKAISLGHKKLKLLSQKLSKLETKFRKAILTKINEEDSYIIIKEKLENTIKKISQTKQ